MIGQPLANDDSQRSFIRLQTDIPIGGHRVVVKSDTGLAYADNTNLAHANAVIGITISAVSAGGKAKIQVSGLIDEPSWNWALHQPIFLGSNGLLTQTAPLVGFSLVAGIPTSATQMSVKIMQPIKLIN